MILLDDPCTPELMYRLVDKIVRNLAELIDWLAVPEPTPAFSPDGIFVAALNRVRQERNGGRR